MLCRVKFLAGIRMKWLLKGERRLLKIFLCRRPEITEPRLYGAHALTANKRVYININSH